jgi:hypothetical protein
MSVNIVVTCTKRKTRPSEPDLRLRNVEAEVPEQRAELWIERLESSANSCVTAAELYAGDHWSIARSLPAVAREHRIRLWVCSAGYGLISVDVPIAPYSATFSSPHPDSVRNGSGSLSAAETLTRWWQFLSRWGGPQAGAPRSIAEIARRDPDSPILVVASAPYLQAMRADLVAAAAHLNTWESLSIVSAGARRMPGLERHLLQFDARLQEELGGALMSLNIRVAREFFRRGWPLAHPELAIGLQEMIAAPLSRHRLTRGRLTDEQVRHFVREALEANPSLACSPLLTRLRRTLQLACEQKRFMRLCAEVRETTSAGFELSRSALAMSDAALQSD